MTLQMGDRAYAEAGWVSQYATHSRAPLSFLIAEALRQAYLHSQWHGRTLVQQPYWYDVQDPSGDLSRTRAFKLAGKTDWGGVARGWATVPRETSHLEAVFIFAVQGFSEALAELRVTVIDASANTDQGESATVITEDAREAAGRANINAGRIQASQNDLARLYDAEAPFTGPFRVHVVRARVALSNVDTDTPGDCEIRVEARANRVDENGDASYTVAVQPLWAEVLAVMDDFDTGFVETAEGATTLSPLALALGLDITAEKLERVHKAQDWAIARRPETHLSLCTAPDGWDDYSGGSSSAVGPLDLTPTGSAETVISTDLWITPEAALADLICGAECLCQVGNEVEIHFSVTGSLGTQTVTVTCTPTDNGTEVTQTITTGSATAGGEWVTLTIAMERTVGVATNNEVRQLRCAEDEIASLNGPLND